MGPEEGMPTVSRPIRLRGRRSQAISTIRVLGVSVIKLFDKLDYNYIPIGRESDSINQIAVVFGDNGTGKTTILRLIYACLSPQTDSGLRTLLAQTPFLSFCVYLSDNAEVSVTKPKLIGNYAIRVKNHHGDETYEIITSPDGRVRKQDSVERFEAALRTLGFDILFVDHNRVVQSTYAFISDNPTVYPDEDRFFLESEFEQLSLGMDVGATDKLRESDLRFPLPQIVEATESWFRAQAFRQGAAGEQDAAGVYLEIAKSISRDRRSSTTVTDIEAGDIPATLNSLKQTTESFIKHGLLSRYPFDELINIYQNASRSKKVQIQAVLKPFLDTIQRRITALDEIHRLITLLENEIGKYLVRKKVEIHILTGLSIKDQKGDINLSLLSSGEKQLLFLLCAAILSRSRRSLILIDEPELSLNYKWQRLIAGSLSSISAGGGTQYLLASHSIEIISRYVETSFELEA